MKSLTTEHCPNPEKMLNQTIAATSSSVESEVNWYGALACAASDGAGFDRAGMQQYVR